jgi:hypothetical protein
MNRFAHRVGKPQMSWTLDEKAHFHATDEGFSFSDISTYRVGVNQLTFTRIAPEKATRPVVLLP